MNSKRPPKEPHEDVTHQRTFNQQFIKRNFSYNLLTNSTMIKIQTVMTKHSAVVCPWADVSVETFKAMMAYPTSCNYHI